MDGDHLYKASYVIDFGAKGETVSSLYYRNRRIYNQSSDLKQVDYCGVRSGLREDKIEKMGFRMAEGVEISVPSIADCPVNIECRVTQVIPLGSHDLFLAEVLHCGVEEKLIDQDNKIHFETANLMYYSHGEYYPTVKKSIGNFGFSVRKKKRKNTCNLKKKRIK